MNKRSSFFPLCAAFLAMIVAGSGCGENEQSDASPPLKTNQDLAQAESVTPDGETDTKLSKTELAVLQKDPQVDGWTTEVWNDRAGKKLKQIGAWLSRPSEISTEEAKKLLGSNGVDATAFQSDQIASWADGQLTIETGPIDAQAKHYSVEEFVGHFQKFAAIFQGNDDVHFKFKIIRVSESDSKLNTVAYFQGDCHDDSSSLQINSTWNCDWKIANGDLFLESLSVSDYELVRGSYTESHLFADCTRSVFQNVDSFDEQLMKSTNYWRRNLQAALGVDLFGHQGMAIGDANGDGLADLYVCQPGGIVNRLYLQQSDGTCRDYSAESNTDYLDRSRAGMFVDFDNDGDQDLALVVDAHVLFLSNDGSARFEQKTSRFVGTSVSIAAADYDLDGDVDLYVCGYSAPRGGEGAPTPYHDANNGYRNHLLQNNISADSWEFVDVTASVGLDQNNSRYTLSASWNDFDNDGDQDLYVANDFGRNNLYRNDGGQFKDIAAVAGVEDISAGMGVCWGDYNRDGLPDIYVSNMFSSAGNRIAYQRKFRTDDSDLTRNEFRRHARGNSLFENAGDGTFRDVSVPTGVTMGRWAWASLFFDFNNDSNLDILVTNGLVTNEDTDDL